MSNFCAEVFGVPLVHRLAELAPNVSCQLDELTVDALTHVHDGKVDVCVTLPQSALFDTTCWNSEICEQQLFRDRFVLVGARDNPALEQPMDHATFCQQAYVEVRFGGRLISNVERVLRRQARRPRIQAWAPSFFHAMAMVSGTDLVAIVPSRLMALHGDRLNLKAIPEPLRLAELEEVAMWHPRMDLDPGHRWLREVMREIASSMTVLEDGQLLTAPTRSSLRLSDRPISRLNPLPN